jgi:hypothetical protein
MHNKFRTAELWGVAIAGIVILGILPALNAFVPETSVFHLSDFTINLYGKYLCYAVLGLHRVAKSGAMSVFRSGRLRFRHASHVVDWKAWPVP